MKMMDNNAIRPCQQLRSLTGRSDLSGLINLTGSKREKDGFYFSLVLLVLCQAHVREVQAKIRSKISVE